MGPGAATHGSPLGTRGANLPWARFGGWAVFACLSLLGSRDDRRTEHGSTARIGAWTSVRVYPLLSGYLGQVVFEVGLKKYVVGQLCFGSLDGPCRTGGNVRPASGQDRPAKFPPLSVRCQGCDVESSVRVRTRGESRPSSCKSWSAEVAGMPERGIPADGLDRRLV